MSQRRVCRVLGQSRSTPRRVRHIHADEAPLIQRMIQLASDYGRYGYRRVAALYAPNEDAFNKFQFAIVLSDLSASSDQRAINRHPCVGVILKGLLT